jgi:hypothetical protein
MSIKVGDLVMITKPLSCCGLGGTIGQIFNVSQISHEYWECDCGAVSSGLCALDANDGLWCPFYRLIKIDPPSMPESLEREKELSV